MTFSLLHPNGVVASSNNHHHLSTHENFSEFFEQWLSEQDRDLQALRSAAEQDSNETHRIRPLITRVISHYEHYYRNKSASAKKNVLPMFSPSWTSSTENLFLWVGGWRPSMAFHLLYSKSGLELESQIAAFIRGSQTRDLADLSVVQLEKIDQLQRRTVKMEKEISEEEARVQETVADTEMVELARAVTEEAEGVEIMEGSMKEKREGMVRVLEKADQLRLDTLKGVVDVLKPMQAAHFLIAAAELHLRVHEFGKSKDAAAATANSRENEQQ